MIISAILTKWFKSTADRVRHMKSPYLDHSREEPSCFLIIRRSVNHVAAEIFMAAVMPNGMPIFRVLCSRAADQFLFSFLSPLRQEFMQCGNG